MRPPEITHSTREERYQYIAETFRCRHNCELCGICQVYGGKEPLIVYEDYIEGKEDIYDISRRYRYPAGLSGSRTYSPGLHTLIRNQVCSFGSFL